MRTANDGNNLKELDGQLEKYSLSTKLALKKSPTLGVALASFAIGTNESEAAIVVTEVNQVISNNGFVLDIAGFGDTEDVEFIGSDINGLERFFALARPGVQVLGRINGSYNYASRLDLGDTVGSSGLIPTGGPVPNIYLAFRYAGGGGTAGDWQNGNTGFFGIAIQNGADVNFGWIEVAVDANHIGGEIVRYAIETEVNTVVLAGAVPEPNSLACLAAGAAGLLGWRQRKRRVA